MSQVIYPMPVVHPGEYWSSVTNVTCPRCKQGTVLWDEAGNVPGWRRCNGCLAQFQARGDWRTPTLELQHVVTG